MARTNCIVTDNGTYLDRDNKRVYSHEGHLIAELCGLDMGEMSDQDLTIITLGCEFAYSQGKGLAQRKFAQKIQEVFGI